MVELYDLAVGEHREVLAEELVVHREEREVPDELPPVCVWNLVRLPAHERDGPPQLCRDEELVERLDALVVRDDGMDGRRHGILLLVVVRHVVLPGCDAVRIRQVRRRQVRGSLSVAQDLLLREDGPPLPSVYGERAGRVELAVPVDDVPLVELLVSGPRVVMAEEGLHHGDDLLPAVVSVRAAVDVRPVVQIVIAHGEAVVERNAARSVPAVPLGQVADAVEALPRSEPLHEQGELVVREAPPVEGEEHRHERLHGVLGDVVEVAVHVDGPDPDGLVDGLCRPVEDEMLRVGAYAMVVRVHG